MRKYMPILIGFLFFISFNAVYAEQAHLDLDDAYIKTAIESYPADSAFELLISKGVPLSLIIDEAQKAGIHDTRIAAGLYQTMQAPEVILTLMQSNLSPGHVLRSLENQGVDPEDVLRLLIENQSDINRIHSTCRYLLQNKGYTDVELLTVLLNAGADRDTLLRVSMAFNIPPATLLEMHMDIHGEIFPFGYVFSRHTLPKPALIAVGLARMHTRDPGLQAPISPKTP